MCVHVYMCVLMPIDCTITYFGSALSGQMALVWSIFYSRITLADQVTWGDMHLYLYTVRSEVRWLYVYSNYFCCESVLYVGWWLRERRRWNQVSVHSLFLSVSTKWNTRINVPIRRMNRYQQFNVPSKNVYCGRVWNLIQTLNAQPSC